MNALSNRSSVSYTILTLALSYAVLLGYAILKQNERAITGLILLAGLLPSLYLLMFHMRYLALGLAFLIPLSVRITLGGGAMVSVPGEPVILALAVFFLIFILIDNKSISQREVYHPISILILVDVLWSIFTGMMGEIPSVSFKRLLIKGMFIIVFYFIFLQVFRKKNFIARLYILYAIGMIIPILWTLNNHSQYGFSKVVAFMMPLPFYNDHTLMATCLAFVIPIMVLVILKPGWFGLHKWSRIFFTGLIFLLLIAEYFTFSRAAWLSIAAGALVGSLVVFLRFRTIHLFLLIMGGSVVLWYYSRDIYLHAEKVDAVSRHEDVGEHMRSVMNIQTDASNLERINRWQCALRMFRDRPFTGFGPGTYQFVYARYQVTNEMTRISTNHGEKGNAHSEYLMYLSETGVPGLLIFLLMIVFAISGAIRTFRNSTDKRVRWLSLAILMGLVSYIFHGLFNSFIDTDKASILFYGSLAAIVRMRCARGKC